VFAQAPSFRHSSHVVRYDLAAGSSDTLRNAGFGTGDAIDGRFTSHGGGGAAATLFDESGVPHALESAAASVYFTPNGLLLVGWGPDDAEAPMRRDGGTLRWEHYTNDGELLSRTELGVHGAPRYAVFSEAGDAAVLGVPFARGAGKVLMVISKIGKMTQTTLAEPSNGVVLSDYANGYLLLADGRDILRIFDAATLEVVGDLSVPWTALGRAPGLIVQGSPRLIDDSSVGLTICCDVSKNGGAAGSHIGLVELDISTNATREYIEWSDDVDALRSRGLGATPRFERRVGRWTGIQTPGVGLALYAIGSLK